MENYRLALSKMAEDIIALRTQVVMLEAENSQLRINLSLHRDQGLDQPDNMDIDSMTKTEIARLIGKPQQNMVVNCILMDAVLKWTGVQKQYIAFELKCRN